MDNALKIKQKNNIYNVDTNRNRKIEESKI